MGHSSAPNAVNLRRLLSGVEVTTNSKSGISTSLNDRLLSQNP